MGRSTLTASSDPSNFNMYKAELYHIISKPLLSFVLKHGKVEMVFFGQESRHQKGRRDMTQQQSQQGRKVLYPGIVSDARIDGGKPIFEGTRVRIDIVLGQLGQGVSLQEVCDEYALTERQVYAALQYASTLV